MSWMRRAASLYRRWRHRDQAERELDDEVQSYFAIQIERSAARHMARGLSREEAERAARIELEGPEQVKHKVRDARTGAAMETILRDIRYALRMLRKAPGFTAVAVLSLALGIGANTAIFTMIEAALWNPIPVKDPAQLRLLYWNAGRDFGTSEWGDGEVTGTGQTSTSFTSPIYQALQNANTSFESLFAVKGIGRITAVVDGSAEPVSCFLVSGDFFRGMGVAPVIGRAFGREDDVRTGANAVAVISQEYWLRRFGGNPAAIGRRITLNQAPVTIIGVNPAYFTGIEPGENTDVWVPLSLQPQVRPSPFRKGDSLLDAPTIWWLPVMGRLKPGVTDAQARSALDAVMQRSVEAAFPGADPHSRPHLQMRSGARGFDHLTGQFGEPLLVLLSLAGLVLLIACANVANLLLAKSAARQREISLRLALGAGQARIVRQLLIEGLVLASLAGAAGILIGYATRNAIPALLATSWRPSPFQAAFDPKVLLISLSITLLTGVLFSLAPAWQVRRVEVNDALKDGSRGTAGLSKLRTGKVLVVLQVALSLLLLVGAGLFIRTFTNLKATPLGFQPERVLLFSLDPPRASYPSDRIAILLAQIEQRIEAIPGVRSATFSTNPLLSGSLSSSTVIPEGQPETRGSGSSAQVNEVGDRFFETIGLPILYGRPLDQRDAPGSELAAVVNQEFARHFFAGQNPIGKRFREHDGKPMQIVGVSADARYAEVRGEIRPTFYRYFLQEPYPGDVTFEVKSNADTAGTVKQIRQIVQSLDSNLAVTEVRTQVEQIEASLSQERLLASLAAAFGGLALILACIGIYGVMAYAVARRTSEIGIRVALGAKPGRVAWMVLRETLLLAGAGFAIGLPAALGLARFTQSFLYGLKPNDPLTLAAAVLALALAGAAAGYLPARRAARVDPMTALRHD